MRQFVFLLLFFGVFSMGSDWRPTAWYEDASFVDNGPPMCREIRVALLGDSIMSGRWVGKYLSDWFGEERWYWQDFGFTIPVKVTIKNFSSKGIGVFEAEKKLSSLLDKFEPTHVVIYVGINDCLRHWDTPQENARFVSIGLNKMVSRVRSYGVEPILVKHHPWEHSWHDTDGRGWECSQMVNEWIDGEEFVSNGAQVVGTMGLGSCDGVSLDGTRECLCDDATCETKFEMDHKLSSGDGLHLSRLGQATLVDMIFFQTQWL